MKIRLASQGAGAIVVAAAPPDRASSFDFFRYASVRKPSKLL